MAEGVETTEELRMVIHLGADLIQGYYTAKPAPEVITDIGEKIKSEMKQYVNERAEGLTRRTYKAGRTGGTMTTCLNAANEEAVFAFLSGKIKLYNIYEITEKMMSEHEVIQNPTIDEIFEVDKIVREKTKKLIEESY